MGNDEASWSFQGRGMVFAVEGYEPLHTYVIMRWKVNMSVLQVF